jgi:hypothetical protein
LSPREIWPVENPKLIPKSALLKAVAEKLIPGIPLQTRISILQQTSNKGPGSGDASESGKEIHGFPNGQLSVLEAVIDRATSRNEIQREIDSKFIKSSDENT